nr:uncharacterized protein LOC126537765 [Dermacentor andersoni]
MTALRTLHPCSQFTADDDLCILREVLGTNPFQDVRLWPQVAKNVVEATSKTFSLRSIRNHCELLMAQFLHKDTANLKKSGTEEQYAEKEQLLTEILALAKEFGYVIRGVTLRNVVAQMQPDIKPATPTDRRAANFERLVAAQTWDTAAAAAAAHYAQRKLRFEQSTRERDVALEERHLELEEKKLLHEQVKLQQHIAEWKAQVEDRAEERRLQREERTAVHREHKAERNMFMAQQNALLDVLKVVLANKGN